MMALVFCADAEVILADMHTTMGVWTLRVDADQHLACKMVHSLCCPRCSSRQHRVVSNVLRDASLDVCFDPSWSS